MGGKLNSTGGSTREHGCVEVTGLANTRARHHADHGTQERATTQLSSRTPCPYDSTSPPESGRRRCKAEATSPQEAIRISVPGPPTADEDASRWSMRSQTPEGGISPRACPRPRRDHAYCQCHSAPRYNSYVTKKTTRLADV